MKTFEGEPASKRPNLASTRLLTYDQTTITNISLSKKLNEIPFSSKIPCSPYSSKSIAPPTPITLAMEQKAWKDDNIKAVKFDQVY